MPTRYQTLVQERADLVAEGDVIFVAAETASRDLSAEERSRDNEIQTRLDAIAQELVLEERRRERERTVAGPTNGTTGYANITAVRDRGADKPWGTDTGAPFGEFLQAVHRQRMHGQWDPRLEPMAVAQGAGETVGADGGFLVQQDIAAGILQRMYQTGEILSRCTRIPIGANSNGIRINALKEASRATGSRWGGITGYWVDEGTAPTASRPKFRRISLEVKKLAALGYATDELLADAAALESVMTNGFTEELTFLTEDAVFEGTGAGQPQGILNSPALLSITKESGQAGVTIVKENIDKMWARLWAPSRSGAVWFINQDIEPQLDSLQLGIGTAGVPVYLPPGGLSETPYARLKGRPVIPTEYNATLGTVGDIVLADMSQYLLIDKSVQQASSMHVAFTTDEMAFRATYRVDGQPSWEAVLTPFKGSNTLSPFVALATRA
jgi:HK97 family phage major capsid protein